MPVARLPEIAEQHAAAAPAEHQRGAETGRPASNDDDVEHQAGTCECKTISMDTIGHQDFMCDRATCVLI